MPAWPSSTASPGCGCRTTGVASSTARRPRPTSSRRWRRRSPAGPRSTWTAACAGAPTSSPPGPSGPRPRSWADRCSTPWRRAARRAWPRRSAWCGPSWRTPWPCSAPRRWPRSPAPTRSRGLLADEVEGEDRVGVVLGQGQLRVRPETAALVARLRPEEARVEQAVTGAGRAALVPAGGVGDQQGAGGPHGGQPLGAGRHGGHLVVGGPPVRPLPGGGRLDPLRPPHVGAGHVGERPPSLVDVLEVHERLQDVVVLAPVPVPELGLPQRRVGAHVAPDVVVPHLGD